MSDKKTMEWDQILSNISLDDKKSAKLTDREGRRYHRSSINELKNSLYGDISSLPIKIVTDDQGTFEGKILDFSAIGCKIEISEDIKRGELVRVKFEVDNHIIAAKAICRWTTSLEPKGNVVGLEFQVLSSDQKEVLNIICTATRFK